MKDTIKTNKNIIEKEMWGYIIRFEFDNNGLLLTSKKENNIFFRHYYTKNNLGIANEPKNK